MKFAAKVFGLTIVACGMWNSMANADVLAVYNPINGLNPDTQGWTWNGLGTVGGGGDTLLLTGANVLFTETVPTNVFNDPWSFTGKYRFAGNSQEEFGRMMFVDDGTNMWHLSFYNVGNDLTDGIYNGGDPNGNPLSNTATKVWAEPVGAGPAGTPANKPFDGFVDYAIVDTDGAGGASPQLYVGGAPVAPAVPLLVEPSKFAAGTIGIGGLNPNDAGFFQIQGLVFEGNPNAVPEPGTLVLMAIMLFGVAPLTARRFRG